MKLTSQSGTLKPQDIAVLLKIIVWENTTKKNHEPADSVKWTLADLSRETGLSISEIHYSLKRSATSQLYRGEERKVNRHGMEELIVHGLKYIFPPTRSGLVRGIPTSYAAPPLSELISLNEMDIPVWPSPEGTVRGISFSPLYAFAPTYALQDAAFYELLVLVDALRGDSRARERAIASELLSKKIIGIP